MKGERILVLDDDPRRRSWFQQKLIGYVVDFAVNAEEALDLLKKNEYSDIFLDRDLSEIHYEKPQLEDGNTGLEVAKWIAQCGRHKSSEIIIHSLNTVGAHQMFLVLQEAGFHVRKVDYITLKNSLRIRS